MQALVTGGAGFIGTHVVRALIAAGHTVTIFDNFSTGKRENIAADLVPVIEGDISDFASLRAAMEGCDVVLHFAGLVSVPRSLSDPYLNHQSNVTGTFHVFEAARQIGVRRVVYASSASVYGSEPGLPKHEQSAIAPLSPYGAAKYIAEVYASVYCQSYPDIEFVGLRYMNVYGPGQDPSSPYSGVLSIFCQAGLNGLPCVIFGDGQQTRDFVFVSDVAQANLLAATVALPERACVLNVGSGQQTSLNQIVAILNNLLPKPLQISHAPARPGDIQHSYADILQMSHVLQFIPQVALREGLHITLNWIRSEQHTDT